MVVYKIVDETSWRQAVERGRYDGSADDLRDEFVHLSTSSQVAGTLAKHFSGRDGLVIAAVVSTALGAALKWEASRGGALFPHLYGPLAMSAVAWVKPIRRGPTGIHELPAEVI